MLFDVSPFFNIVLLLKKIVETNRIADTVGEKGNQVVCYV